MANGATVRTRLRAALVSRDPDTFRGLVEAAVLLLRAHIFLRRCTRVGRLTRVRGRPRVHNGGAIVIGERCLIHSTTIPVELAAMPGGRIEIGARTFLNYGVAISAHELVRIGERCLLGVSVMILDNDWHDILDRTKTPPSRPVVIEDRVWLGNRVIVLPGVTIGHDAVVGAGAVVTRDVPPRSIAAGNPARVVKRF